MAPASKGALLNIHYYYCYYQVRKTSDGSRDSLQRITSHVTFTPNHPSQILMMMLYVSGLIYICSSVESGLKPCTDRPEMWKWGCMWGKLLRGWEGGVIGPLRSDIERCPVVQQQRVRSHITTTRVRISAWAYPKGVSSLTSLPLEVARPIQPTNTMCTKVAVKIGHYQSSLGMHRQQMF